MRAVTASDLAALAAWHAGHGQAAPLGSALPATGLIEPGVAAGFLYLTDSSLAYLDGFITNPSAPLRARSLAVDRITDALRVAARTAGRRHVVALCMSPGIARRAVKHGLRLAGTPCVLAIGDA